MTSRCCLITGGSGFLGINLVRHLSAQGLALRSLDIAPFDYPERARIDPIMGDIRDAGAVERAMQGMHTVAHCAAALPLASAAEIASTGVDGPTSSGTRHFGLWRRSTTAARAPCGLALLLGWATAPAPTARSTRVAGAG